MTEEELTLAVHAIEEYTNMVEDIQQEADRLKSAVKEHMKIHGLTEVEVDGRRIRLHEVNTHRFDISEFKKSYRDLHEHYSIPLKVFKLTITEIP